MKFSRKFLPLKKAFRSLAVGLSLAGLIYYSHGAFLKWNVQPDIATTSHLIPASEIPLPALTFCNSLFPRELHWAQNNPSSYIKNFAWGKVKYRLKAAQQNFVAVLVHTCGPKEFTKDMMGAFVNRTEMSVVKTLWKSHYPVQSHYCQLRTEFLGCEKIFKDVFTEYGKCETFNMLGYHRVFNNGSMHQDFDLFRRTTIAKLPSDELFDDDNDTIEWTLSDGYRTNDDATMQPMRASKRNMINISFKIIAKEDLVQVIRCTEFGSGFKAIVHLPSEMPTPFHEELFFKEKYDTKFIVSAEVHTAKPELRKFPPDVRQCYFEGERQLRFFKSYTKNHCDYECMTNYTLQKCGCVKFSMPRSQDTPVCDVDMVECSFLAAKDWPNVDGADGENLNHVMACNCYPACIDIQYSFKVAKDAQVRLKLAQNHSITRVVFEFTPHSILEYESYVAYTLQNWIADIGGLIGLFLGFSLLSIFEFVYESIEQIVMRRNKVENSECSGR